MSTAVYLDIIAALEPALTLLKTCRDEAGRFASCGVGDSAERAARRQAIGKHRRQMRRRKPKNAEHADWIRHFKRERREHARDIKRERRELKREHRKERKQQRREHRQTIRDMHREHPRTGSRRGSVTRLDVADQIRTERRQLHGQQADERREHRDRHREDIEGRHRDERESHAEVLHNIRRDRHEAAGKTWRGKTVSPVGEIPASLDAPIPTARHLAERAADRAGLLDRWRDGTITGREALDVLHALRLEARAILRGWAADLVEWINPEYQRPKKGLGRAIKAGVGKFFGKVRGFIKEAFVAGVLTLTGPHFDVAANRPVNDAVAAQVQTQETYLAAFEAETLGRIEAAKPRPATPAGEPPNPEEAKPPVDGTFVARAEQYGSSVWAGAQNALRETSKVVFPWEKRVHLPPWTIEDPCADCLLEINKGWQPSGTLKPIGLSRCRGACHCNYFFATELKGDETVEWVAGRGPLYEPVFGHTG